MGTTAHLVVVDGSVAVLDRACARLGELEHRWSRFRPTSEVSQLNAYAAVPVKVSADTYDLIAHAARAFDLTAGRYDPTVLDAVCNIGYDASFEAVRERRKVPSELRIAAPGCASMRLDPRVPAVTLGRGVGFDPGGIGKGLAADIVVRELRAAGASGAMCNIGGDLALDGTPPDSNGWIVGIEDPMDATTNVARVTIERGAVCTSSRVRRTWIDANGRRIHHLVDPRNGTPLVTTALTITVVAGAAWWAEACATALFVEGAIGGIPALRGHALLDDIHVLVIEESGTITTFGDPGVFDLASDVSARAS